MLIKYICPYNEYMKNIPWEKPCYIKENIYNKLMINWDYTTNIYLKCICPYNKIYNEYIKHIMYKKYIQKKHIICKKKVCIKKTV